MLATHLLPRPLPLLSSPSPESTPPLQALPSPRYPSLPAPCLCAPLPRALTLSALFRHRVRYHWENA
eukprot:2328479-Rhodomonas_salina.1